MGFDMNEHSKPTRDDFLKWRCPVRGTQNPERMENPFWKWCIQNRESAYAVNEKLDGPDSISSGPCWCFDRMGQARVALPDGREAYIAGEHEDHYDPDFYIYNDVVIIDGTHIAIFGYPEIVFPPTDFHSATLVESDIFLVGNLGYPHDRVPDKTQALRLDVETWRISQVETTGAGPGWIHGHTAIHPDSENAIIVSGGNKLFGERILENFDDYRLCLKTLTWTRLTDRKWDRWILEREDGNPNRLWEIRTASWHDELGISMQDQLKDAFPDLPPDLLSELNTKASKDQIGQIQTLYRSPWTNDLAIQDDDHYGRYRLDVQGTTVRFDEDTYNITVTVEGHLPTNVIGTILSNLQNRLSKIENTPYTLTRIDA